MTRPISKWCRYGFWSEDGAMLFKTYERAKPYNPPVILFEQGQAYVNRHAARELSTEDAIVRFFNTLGLKG